MFQKVFEYAGPHKKGLYAATAIVLVSVLLGVFPFVLAYQVIAPLVMGEAITASFIIQHVILVLVCLVLQALFYGWGLNLSHKAAYDTLLRLRTALQKRFEKLPLGVIQDKGTGTVKKLFVDDVDSLEVLLAHSMPEGIANLMVPIAVYEATAYADPENEEKMEAAIAELVKGKTLVVIAHKLPAIMNADQICVIDHGKLVAAGKHQDLIRSCPEYQKLWKAAQDSAEWKVHTAKEGA